METDNCCAFCKAEIALKAAQTPDPTSARMVDGGLFGPTLDLLCSSEDYYTNNHRRVLRLLNKFPDSIPIAILSGNMLFAGGHYKFALGMSAAFPEYEVEVCGRKGMGAFCEHPDDVDSDSGVVRPIMAESESNRMVWFV